MEVKQSDCESVCIVFDKNVITLRVQHIFKVKKLVDRS